MTEYFALTERRSEEAKRIRREFREQHGKDFSPRRGKVIVPREDGLANCVTATQGIEQYLLEVTEGGEYLSELIFVGGIDGKKRWLDDGKSFSLNYKQGNRVYSADGVATALSAQPVGGTGGYTSLYVIDESETKGERNLTKTNEVNTEVSGNPFTYVSLFSGIGGFETALNKLGGTCVLASEIDRFANQSYEALYGHATAGDITKIAAEDVPDHDVLVGGFPCQSFSVAGKHGGFDDARGTLFFEVARIAKTNQPRMLLLENVKGLVGHDGGKTLDTIVQTLNDIGYHVDFNVLNSKYFGVPQNRERIFIVALRDDIAKRADWNIEGTNVVAKGKRRIAAYDGVKTFNFDWPEQTEVTTRLRDILETEVDEKYYLSDEKTATLVAQLEANGEPNVNKDMKLVGYADIDGHDFNKRIYSVDGVSRTLNTASDIGRAVKVAEPQMVGANGLNTLEDGTAYCITTRTHANYDYRGAVAKKQATLIEEHTPKYRIRKLTPKECFALQGFSSEAHQKLVDAGLSDSQRYKQAGNAVTVNVIKAIGEKLLPLLSEEGA